MERNKIIAILSIACIVFSLIFKYSGLEYQSIQLKSIPLLICIFLGGGPLILELVKGALKLKFNADILAGISITTSLFLDEYMAGTIVVLMLSGGQALEDMAMEKASNALDAFAKRLPNKANLFLNGQISEVELTQIKIGDEIVIKPHEVSPLDGEVVNGEGAMDESVMTGEAFLIAKSIGSKVISGSSNSETALHIKVTAVGEDTRYKKIATVMKESQEKRPEIRRLADELGAWYTPVALVIATIAGLYTSDWHRFLSVIVVATPCPLLIGIPISIIGSISVAARKGILIKNPAILERVSNISTVFLDKTGTMTEGKPSVTEVIHSDQYTEDEILSVAASLEQYSSHPLSEPIVAATKNRNLKILTSKNSKEIAGLGLTGEVEGKDILITSRKHALIKYPSMTLPDRTSGLECVIIINNEYAGTIKLRDTLREGGSTFIQDLKNSHHIKRVALLSGDDLSEVEYLAKQVGIEEILARQSPEDKLRIIKEATAKGTTLFVGDGINDAPALAIASIGVAMGTNSDISGEASGAVILDSSLQKLDFLLHLGVRMRKIALQSAVGGMALSILGMIFAAFGHLSPVAGAMTQEAIDVLAVLNALRATTMPKEK